MALMNQWEMLREGIIGFIVLGLAIWKFIDIIIWVIKYIA